MTKDLNIHQKINLRALAKEFPVIAKKEMAERFRKLKIGQSGLLLNDMSFRGKVLVNGIVVEIDYWYYGVFVDLGVGKGISLDDVTIARMVGSGRRKKNWTRKLAAFRHRLGELYTDIAAEEIAQHANQSLDRTLRFKL
jgi:hypothetical protein